MRVDYIIYIWAIRAYFYCECCYVFSQWLIVSKSELSSRAALWLFKFSFERISDFVLKALHYYRYKIISRPMSLNTKLEITRMRISLSHFISNYIECLILLPFDIETFEYALALTSHTHTRIRSTVKLSCKWARIIFKSFIKIMPHKWHFRFRPWQI